jgi:hypothetical protein
VIHLEEGTLRTMSRPQDVQLATNPQGDVEIVHPDASIAMILHVTTDLLVVDVHLPETILRLARQGMIVLPIVGHRLVMTILRAEGIIDHPNASEALTNTGRGRQDRREFLSTPEPIFLIRRKAGARENASFDSHE